MAKTRPEKEAAVQALAEAFQAAKAVVFANFQGLKVSEVDELRNLCRQQGIQYVAGKKTLLKRALQEVNLPIEVDAFQGGIGLLFGAQDEVAPAQLIAKFHKNHEAAKIFGGILEGRFIEANKVVELAKLPGKSELLSRLVGTLNAPIAGLVNVLAGNIRALVNVLNAIKEAKV